MNSRYHLDRCSRFAAAFTLIAMVGCSAPQFASVETSPSTNGGLGDLKPPEPTATPSPTPTAPAQVGHTSFTQASGANQVDILIVNDNSFSMYAEQQKMAQRFGSFISSISDLDYHIGMTTTDAESSGGSHQGELLKWFGTESPVITPATVNAADAFLNTVARKETLNCSGGFGFGCPSGDEQPIKNVIQALEARETFNAGFFREAADLIVIILSDEDEASDGGSSATRGSVLVERFHSIYGYSKNLRVHGIVVRPDDTQCLAAQRAQAGNDLGSQYGRHVAELAQLTGGTVGDICADDYSSQLANISRETRRLITSVELDHVPVADSVKVTFVPDDPIPFTVEGKTLIFSRPPAPGTKVDITFEY